MDYLAQPRGPTSREANVPKETDWGLACCRARASRRPEKGGSKYSNKCNGIAEETFGWPPILASQVDLTCSKPTILVNLAPTIWFGLPTYAGSGPGPGTQKKNLVAKKQARIDQLFEARV